MAGPSHRKELPHVFYLRYLGAELRRRKGRTILTATCLALGVGMVVAVTSLSAGLDDAQAKVLDPLTGVGTEMSVARPLSIDGPPQDLSAKERKQLQREGAGPPIGLDNLGKPGQSFDTYQYRTLDLSFPAAKEKALASLDNVQSTAAGLTVDVVHVSGKVPKSSPTAGGMPIGPAAGGPPDSLGLDSETVSGVDVTNPDLGLVTRSQITDGSYFHGRGAGQAVVSQAYATQQDIAVGDHVKVGKGAYEVVGLSSGAVGGQSSDVYIELGALQKAAGLEGRVNAIQVNATSAGDVDSVAAAIKRSFSGSEVTTSSDVADQVSGSLVNAKDLSGKLGTALAVVALLGAFGIASLVTLSSVSKRTRELGTLKALGWRQALVVRQVAGESVVQGLLGGIGGAALGLAAAAAIGAAGISLDASLPAATGGPGGFMAGPGAGGPPGVAQAASSAVSTVTLGAPVSPGVIALAIGLAVVGGLVAGTAGGLRTARLRPAEALRSVE
jgi:putative ABC transport system permease protein